MTNKRVIMPPENMTRSLIFLTGQVHALFMFSQAVAKGYPNRDELVKNLNEASQMGLASLEQLPDAGDFAIDGYQFVIDSLRKVVGAA